MRARVLLFQLLAVVAMLLATASASARVETQTRVRAVDSMLATCIELEAGRTLEHRPTNRFDGPTNAADSCVAAEGAVASGEGSVGAMSASQRLLNWSPKSTPTWGHTFLRHGEGPAVTRGLVGRAGGTGQAQGQWLNNEAAANFLSSERPYIQGPTAVQLPSGVPAQVILPNGTVVPAGHALLVPAPGGGFITAFPFLP